MGWLWKRGRKDADLDRELRSHLAAEADEQCQTGVSAEEAAFAARRAFGNMTATKEDVRQAWGGTKLEQIAQDFSYAFRMLLHNPGFTLTAVLSLAIGIGANTAIFTVVNAVLLHPLPFPQPDRLVQIWESKPAKGFTRNVVNPINFLEWRDRAHIFEGMCGTSARNMNLTGDGDPVAIAGMDVSWEFFLVLRIAPALGRSFLPREGLPGQEHVAVISYKLWKSRYSGDPNILGRKVIVDGDPTTVVGVMPASFSVPRHEADLWIPLPITRSKEWEGRFMEVIGRMKPGVTLQQARTDMSAVAHALSTEQPDRDQGWGTELYPMLDDATHDVRLPLLVLFAAVGLVLLIACANVGNLLLMRATRRAEEISLRAALGASRIRLVQQLLSESVMLVIFACMAGLIIGYGGLEGLLALLPEPAQIPRLDTVHMDGQVFLFTVALSLLSALLFGLVPSLQVSQTNPQQTLRSRSSRASARAGSRKTLVVLEVAVCLILLSAAGLMLRSFQRLLAVDPGFETEHILTMRMLATPARYQDDRKRALYFENVIDAVRRVPGVQAAGSIHFLPLQELTSGSGFSFLGEPLKGAADKDAEFLIISPGYFETMRVPLIAGRAFGVPDGLDRPTAIIVNQQFARKFFPHLNPIGQKLNLDWTVPSPGEIVGVVADARQTELQKPPKPTIFLNNFQAPMYFAQLAVRTVAEPNQMAHAIVEAIRKIDRDQPLTDIKTMDQVLSDSVAQPRLELMLLLTFASMAALLAIIGVYGVVSYSVSQRMREIGIRSALGAQPNQVQWTILREGASLAGTGIGIGLACALAFTRALRTMLFEITPSDPLTLGSVVMIVALAAVLASLIPARRAAHMDPMISLRYE